MRTRLFALAAVLLGATAQAAPAPADAYDSCLTRTQTDPGGALAFANDWDKKGGGPAADHCAALALIGLHRYGEAAARLDALAKGPFAADAERRAALYDQAGNAWLLAGRADAATASFTAGLSADSFDADLLSDRARALALRQDWPKAESDLSAALLVNPERADLYVLRGSARHAMGRRADALADFDRALRLQPGNADALVERGSMRLESGDSVGATGDWQAAIRFAPGSEAAATAKQRLDAIGH